MQQEDLIMSRWTNRGLLCALVVVLFAGISIAQREIAPTAKPVDRPALALRVSGPITHDNLTIFLIHGDDQLKDRKLITLDEALEQKKIVVHETKDVNKLAIENTADVDVFVQAGDIVKGGQQDRILAFDMIVPAKSGKLPIDSFCVEAGRWQMRSGNSADKFDSAKAQAGNKDIKLACRLAHSQRVVWEQVDKTQMKLGEKVGADVKSADSKTSLQLSLEHKKVLEAVAAYEKALKGTVDGKNDVIGIAVAVNGKMNSADVYATHDLFTKLWPKVLNAAVVEAVTELEKGKKLESPTLDAAKSFLADAEKGKRSDKEINARLAEVTQEGEKLLLFETLDREQKNACLRRSYLAK
jgi:hypothetical protein